MFDMTELCKLYRIVLDEAVTEVGKKQFLELMRVALATVKEKRQEISSAISDDTKNRFIELLATLKNTKSSSQESAAA